MHLKIITLGTIVLTYCALLTIGRLPIVAQSVSNEWLPIGIESVGFSVEVPVRHRIMFSKEGFNYSSKGEQFRLKNIYFLRSYENDTLLALDVYEGKSRAVQMMYNHIVNGNFKRGPQIKGKKYSVRQAVLDSPRVTVRQQYISLGKYNLILTAASRKGETEEMKRFLQSATFNSDEYKQRELKATELAALKLTELLISMHQEGAVTNNGSIDGNDNKDVTLPTIADDKKLHVISKPIPGYTDAARTAGVSGKILLKVKFGNDGFIPEIVVLNGLPHGLLRQAIFAALRIRFLPMLEGESPIEIVRNIEYSFSIY